MRSVIVTGVARADLAVVDQLAGFGVATVHEAIGRAGYLGPGLRPIQDGARTGGTAVTALCWPGDAIIADDDGVVCVPRADVGQALAAARARVAKEEQSRKALADGQLGLDLYGLRDKLAARGVEYVTAGGDEG